MTLAIIGGSGLYDLPELKNRKEERVKTPYGDPSAPIITGEINGVKVLFLARHGIGHSLIPGEINYLANIYSLKSLGAKWVLSVSAAGSLAEDIPPGSIVVPTQFLDFTSGRPKTFFGEGICAHVQFASPVCKILHSELAKVFAGDNLHDKGCYVCIQGPTFATRAESAMYRQLGGTVIGMTNLPEARLAREAELAYCTLAIITDYDSWRSEEDDVNVPEILKILKNSLNGVKSKLPEVCSAIADKEPDDGVANALKSGILTSFDKVPPETKEKLKPILGKYLG